MSLKGITALKSAITRNYERLCCIVANTSQSNEILATLATEATQLDVLAAIDMMRDYEVRLVVDDNDVTWLEVRYWDVQDGTLGAPVYYPPGSTVAGTPSGVLSYINPNTLLTQLLNELQVLNTTDFATETTLATLLTEATFASTDFSTETTLAALLTAFNSEDFASEVTLAALLTAFNSEDFASEATLASLLAAFSTEDFATETTLAALALTDFATETTLATLAATDFATETTLALVNSNIVLGNTTLNSLLTAFNAEDFATETTLASVASDLSLIYTDLQLNTVSVADINTKLTGASRTPSVVVSVADASTVAGSQSVSLWFRGANGTLGGGTVPNGARFTFTPLKGEDTVGAIAYTVPTGGAQEVIITYLT